MDPGIHGSAKSVVVMVMVVLISVAFSSRGSIAQRIPSDEVAALKTISEKLNNTYWKNVSETSCSDNGETFNTTIASGIFSNVTCDCSFNSGTVCHVTNILLKGLNLSGVFPAEFGNLTQLTLIDLSRNYINGSIPASLSKIPLVNIALVGNRISGPIPDEFGNISTLQLANFEDNQFSGQLPASLGKLSNLQRLLLTSNFFNGTIPESFGNLKNLTDFRVDGSNFTGPIPDFIGNWTAMTTLNIQGAFSEGPIPATLSLLTNMSELRISDLNQSSTPFPDLQNMTNLQILILRNCLITGTIPDYIGSMTKLKTLDLSFNQLTGPILDSIGSSLEDLFLSNNSLSGTVPGWLVTRKQTYIDVSYNNFTGSASASCQNTDVNLASSFSSRQSNSNNWCLMKDLACPADAQYYSLYINCGGGRISYDGNDYLADTSTGSPSYFSSTGNQWALSSTGTFMYNSNAAFTALNTYNLSISGPEYFQTARVSASSLKYYGLCLRKGTYTVQLYFAEIMYSNDKTYASLGNRIFDIYIQGTLRQKNFNIMTEAGGVGKGINKTYSDIVVNGSTLEIFLYWAGKGTTAIPGRGVYGPLISAITVKPNFRVSNGFSVGAIVGIVIASFAVLVSVLVLLKRKGYLGGKDDEDNNEFRGLDTGYFSLRQIQAATNNFSPINKIGEGGFGPVFKGVLPDGKVIAVKQLSAKSKQGNREFINEIGMISALQHPNLVKLHGCCIEGKELLLVYEYMVNNSLARVLFVVLEIVSGKSNTNYRPKEEFVYLLDWACVLQEQGNLLELVDPSLGSDYSEEEAMMLLNLALLCTSLSPSLRPNMSSVVSMILGEIPVQAPKVMQGRLTDELRFRAFERKSQDRASEISMGSMYSDVQRSISTDGPWIESSTSVQALDETRETTSSSSLLHPPMDTSE
ncbi:hypothetical protein Droror1_Dr00027900 [Drosera rotundifolia]